MLLESLYVCAILATAVAVAAITVTKSKVFEWFRDLVSGIPFLGKLFQCHYCFSHWLAGALVWAVKPSLLPSQPYALDWAVTSLVVVALAMPAAGMVFKTTTMVRK